MIHPRKKNKPSDESGERESSGFRAALPQPALDDETAARVLSLLVNVEREEGGMPYPPEWAATAHVAKTQNWVSERGLRLYLTEHGKLYLRTQEVEEPGSGKYTMTKVDRRTKLMLKDLARETDVFEQELIGLLVGAIYANRVELTKEARRRGLAYPWEVIRELVGRK